MTVTDGSGRPVRDAGLARWLGAVAPARVRGDVAIALVSDQAIRALNRRYRGQDRATDVLSFPSRPARPTGRGSRGTPADLPLDPGHLGDIVIATGTAARQAREAGHPLATELRVLALHGLLHLLGYDHDHPADGGRMARAELRLRRRGGLEEGLIARAGTTRVATPAGKAPGTRRTSRRR